MRLPVALRWALVPVASMAGCSGSVFVADAVGTGARRFITPDVGSRIEALVPVDVRVGIVYAIAAAVWVIVGTRVAPTRRAVVPVALFAAGACLAWLVLHSWYFPESHPRAYQPSQVPLVLTLVGGLVGSAAMIVYLGKSRNAVAWSQANPDETSRNA
jgi:uncharacterized membrane protein (UPF0136 family)